MLRRLINRLAGRAADETEKSNLSGAFFAACEAWVLPKLATYGQDRNDVVKKCVETRDDGYSKCVRTRDDGYSTCCEWWPCSWACAVIVWVSNVVCVAWTWVSNVVCVAWAQVIYVARVSLLAVAFLCCYLGAITLWVVDLIIGR